METGLKPDPVCAAPAPGGGVALPLLAAMLVMLTFLTVPRAPIELYVDTDTALS